MGWKIIEAVTADHLTLFLDNLVVKKSDIKFTIPLNDIDVLIIDNVRTNLSVQLLNELVNHNISVVICNQKHAPSFTLLPYSGNYKTSKIFRDQLTWSTSYKAVTWQQIVKMKIKNQLDFLKHFRLGSRFALERIQDAYNHVDLFDRTNREGHVAKVYWHVIYGKEFSRDDDTRYANSLLNYGYTILLSYFSRSIVKKGLDPRISFFHKTETNQFALSCDLMEPFRILVDLKVYELLKSGKNAYIFGLDKEDLVKLFAEKMIINQKKQYINNAIDDFVDCIVKQRQLPELGFFDNEGNQI